MLTTEIAYLGPQGTFAHLVAEKRYRGRTLIPQNSIDDVFRYVQADPGRKGIVPIENSSGGTIYETVDHLIDRSCTLSIQEELSIKVRLALLGHKRESVRVLYSHFAPFHHCDGWIKENFPDVERRETKSTAEAAKLASSENNAAALGTRDAAHVYNLDILHFPVTEDVPNVTQFFSLGHKTVDPRLCKKTSIVASLRNAPGSLVAFLEPFSKAGVNLTRIVSRPVAGHPNTYVFFVDIAGTVNDPTIKRALTSAGKVSRYIRVVGTYPIHPSYTS
jgi:prephenate dehydratase